MAAVASHLPLAPYDTDVSPPGALLAVSADLAKLLDKDWEDKNLDEVLAAPVAALSGVSDGDAAALARAFNIKTVGDLGRNKYVRAACCPGRTRRSGLTWPGFVGVGPVGLEPTTRGLKVRCSAS